MSVTLLQSIALASHLIVKCVDSFCIHYWRQCGAYPIPPIQNQSSVSPKNLQAHKAFVVSRKNLRLTYVEREAEDHDAMQYFKMQALTLKAEFW